MGWLIKKATCRERNLRQKWSQVCNCKLVCWLEQVGNIILGGGRVWLEVGGHDMGVF